MRKFVSSFSLLLLLAVPFAGQTDEWKKYSNTKGNFSAMFPAEPTDSTNASDASMESHTLMARQPPAAYMVTYSTMASEQTVDNVTYEVYKKAVFAQLPSCEVDQEQPPSPVLQGYIGHWYRLNCNMSGTKVVVLGNLYWGRHYAYAVMAIVAGTEAEPAGLQRFVTSFSQIDPAK